MIYQVKPHWMLISHNGAGDCRWGSDIETSPSGRGGLRQLANTGSIDVDGGSLPTSFMIPIPNLALPNALAAERVLAVIGDWPVVWLRPSSVARSSPAPGMAAGTEGAVGWPSECTPMPNVATKNAPPPIAKVVHCPKTCRNRSDSARQCHH